MRYLIKARTGLTLAALGYAPLSIVPAILLILPLFLMIHSTGDDPSTGILVGTVLDTDSSAVVGATVIIVGTNRGDYTDARGAFEIKGVKPGRYEVKVAHPSYDDALKEGVVIERGKVTSLAFMLEIASSNVTVTAARELRREETGQVSITEGYNTHGDVKIRGGRSSETRKTTTTVLGAMAIKGSGGGWTARPSDRFMNHTIQASDIDIGAVSSQEIVSESILGSDILRGAIGTPAEETSAIDGHIDFDTATLFPDSPEPVQNEPSEESPPERRPSVENHFRHVAGSPFSTFGIDVDAASYTNVRFNLDRGESPTPDLVRIEELINYFRYDYRSDHREHPVAVHTELTECPWEPGHELVRVAVTGREINPTQASPSNLVFLVDVSGSMSDDIDLLVAGLNLLVDELRSDDHVAIVVYAGAAGVVLPSTPGTNRVAIKNALGGLRAGGSTAGGAGIKKAYEIAAAGHHAGVNSRVILCTDGDFNVGISSRDELVALIEEEREKGIFLSVLGFGVHNFHDHEMEQLADNGNGNYYYIDRIGEAERILVSEMAGTLYTIAKDVKLQIQFNPDIVEAYRLIGYENRVLAARDFENDTVDAGDLGAGHQVTALYQIVRKGRPMRYRIDTAKSQDYQLDNGRGPSLMSAHDLMTISLRYKNPTDSASKLIEQSVTDRGVPFESASEATRFASAVAEWGMLMRGSTYRGAASFEAAASRAALSAGWDGRRREFPDLVRSSSELMSSLTE